MNAYPTYQAAKIANPEYAIFEYLDKFGTDKDIIEAFDIHSVAMKECNPADYCMTVKQFLDAGHKFVEGDKLICSEGNVGSIECDDVVANNREYEDDDKRYILKAKALEETKTYRYEKVELSPKEVFMAMLNGEEFYVLGDLLNFDGEQFWRHTEEGKSRITYINHDHEIHRRIEVTERELFIEEAMRFNYWDAQQLIGQMYDSGKFKLVNGKG